MHETAMATKGNDYGRLVSGPRLVLQMAAIGTSGILDGEHRRST
jgi:hypothetical protein